MHNGHLEENDIMDSGSLHMPPFYGESIRYVVSILGVQRALTLLRSLVIKKVY